MRAAAIAGTVLLALAPAPARAQDAGLFAQQRYDRAVALFRKGSFSEALAEFRASYEIQASPNTRLMIAHCLKSLGRRAEAFGEYELTAREAADRAAANPRYGPTETEARQEAQSLRRRIGFVRVQLPAGSEPIRLSVAGRGIPQAALSLPVPVDPGSVEVVAEGDARRAVQRVEVSAGQEVDLPIELKPAVTPPAVPATRPRALPPVPPATPPRPQPTGERHGPHLAAWVVLGAGAATLAGGGVLALVTNERYDDLEAACSGGPCPPGHESEVERGERLERWTQVTLGVGAAATLLGGALVWLTWRSGAADSEGTGPRAVLDVDTVGGQRRCRLTMGWTFQF